MKKLLAMLLAVTMVFSMASFAVAEGPFTPGTYTQTVKGFAGDIVVDVTVDENAITAVAIDLSGDTTVPAALQAAEDLQVALVGATTADDIDTMTSATASFTIAAVKSAVTLALTEAAGEEQAAIAFVPGTYTGTGAGYNGPVVLSVTFSEDAITDIEVVSSKETARVGTPAFPIMFEEIKTFTSTGVDSVTGATFTSKAILAAVEDAAEQAGCSKLALQQGKEPYAVVAGEPIELTYDIVIIGAGGAGVAAAAQAAMDGNTVLIIEKNAEIGGNTLVSGGQYQSVMPYLVWDPENPDATEGLYAHDGQTYPKVKNTAKGNLDTLQDILDWNENEFDPHYFDDHEYVAGDIKDQKNAGVHAAYLPTLLALKEEIRPYLAWAEEQMANGVAETELTLFSTVNLHVFQTYYGGLRQSADGQTWIYGDVDLVRQFIEQGQGLKEWLEDQGSVFDETKQLTLIGALWYRENVQVGSNFDFDGDGANETGNWGAYFVPPVNTMLTANEANQIMLRTTADELIVENGQVLGVKATKYDGTPVTAWATKGVILATGGYASNIPMVMETNEYWAPEYVTAATETTNRNSLMGDGIVMAQAIGAATTGEGFTQMMPISWIDNGDLAFGSGAYCVYINPTTGHRFVNETSERDVLSLAEFRNGVDVNGTMGVFMEISNAESLIRPYAYINADGTTNNDDVAWRQYVRTIDELPELFAELGFPCDAAVVRSVIEEYDMAFMTDGQYPDVDKTGASTLIGKADSENGIYDPSTYTLDGVELRVRIMAPSTHHTMGGLLVDLDRHVLNTEGEIIPGLYAAGEVTGGIHGGNRLGGNAIVEIFVSGRIAAQSADADAAALAAELAQ